MQAKTRKARKSLSSKSTNMTKFPEIHTSYEGREQCTLTEAMMFWNSSSSRMSRKSFQFSDYIALQI
jgi:hypothetical protein